MYSSLSSSDSLRLASSSNVNTMVRCLSFECLQVLHFGIICSRLFLVDSETNLCAFRAGCPDSQYRRLRIFCLELLYASTSKMLHNSSVPTANYLLLLFADNTASLYVFSMSLVSGSAHAFECMSFALAL